MSSDGLRRRRRVIGRVGPRPTVRRTRAHAEPRLAHAWFNLGALLQGPARRDPAAAKRAYARAAAFGPRRSSAATGYIDL